MANEVYTTKEITLQDETEVVLKPLPIAVLRRFMKAWRQHDGEEDEDGEKSLDVFINVSGIALESQFLEKFEKTRGTGKEEWLSKDYRDYLEGVLDMDTIYMIIEVCAGMKLNDPNLLAAAAAARVSVEGGTT
jgi:hypothetical protein